MSVEKAAEVQGEAGADLGMGMGLMMPAIFAQFMAGQGGGQSDVQPLSQPQGGFEGGAKGSTVCPDCKNPVPPDARFYASSGHQIMVFQQSRECGKNLPPHAKFCSRCGTKAEQVEKKHKRCSKYSEENLPTASFYNQFGERLKPWAARPPGRTSMPAVRCTSGA